MSYTAQLRQEASPIWEATMGHPFLGELQRGDLEADRFRFYIQQDYVFLIDYARFLALASAKASDLAAMSRLATLLATTLNTEMALHRSFCAEFGITVEELEATQVAPTTHAYTRHLLTIAYSGTFPDCLAALLPCQWGYCEIAKRLVERGLPEHRLYAQWIRTYADPGFAELAAWMRQLLDTAALDASPAERARWTELFLTSSRYEYGFWDMAYRQERWSV